MPLTASLTKRRSGTPARPAGASRGLALAAGGALLGSLAGTVVGVLTGVVTARLLDDRPGDTAGVLLVLVLAWVGAALGTWEALRLGGQPRPVASALLTAVMLPVVVPALVAVMRASWASGAAAAQVGQAGALAAFAALVLVVALLAAVAALAHLVAQTVHRPHRPHRA